MLKIKVKAAFLHFCLSILVAALTAYIVFSLWFPYPYSEMSGGRTLFWLVIWVDICCGPLLTFILMSNKKSRKELCIDLSLVAVIQLAALAYGLYSVMLARPIFLVFEVDRFRVVSLAEVGLTEFKSAKSEFKSIKFFGPSVIAVRVPLPGDSDYRQSLELSSKGIPVSVRPMYWVQYREKIKDVLARSRSLADLHLREGLSSRINNSVSEYGFNESELRYLPMQSRNYTDWIVLINATTAEVVGYVNVDGF